MRPPPMRDKPPGGSWFSPWGVLRVAARGLDAGKGVEALGQLASGGMDHCKVGVAALVAAAAGRVMSANSVAAEPPATSSAKSTMPPDVNCADVSSKQWLSSTVVIWVL